MFELNSLLRLRWFPMNLHQLLFSVFLAEVQKDRRRLTLYEKSGVSTANFFLFLLF